MRAGGRPTAHRVKPTDLRAPWLDAGFARCDLLLGELDLAAKAPESAAALVGRALPTFHEAHQGQDLPDALLAMARLRRTHARAWTAESASPDLLSGHESALADCEEALRITRRSGFLLKQCDAFNLHALQRREAGAPAKAYDDAKQALKLAEQCGYYWGRHEALRQLRDAARDLGNHADQRHWDDAEEQLADKMKPEIEEALRINREHDAAMDRAYV